MRKKIKIEREDLNKVKEKRADRNDVGAGVDLTTLVPSPLPV